MSHFPSPMLQPPPPRIAFCLVAAVAALALATAVFSAIVMIALALVSVPAAAATASSSPSHRAAAPAGPTASVHPALKNAPGYYPPADPESLSVELGRRLNAPAVQMSFAGGTRTLEDLGRVLCRAIHFSSVDSLRDLCIAEGEFARILWREFPQSRPATGLQAEDAWLLLENRNHGGIARALQDHGGRHLRFARWERAETVAVYRNFRLHNGLTLVVLNEEGDEERLDVVRSVAERKGRFKLYSLKD